MPHVSNVTDAGERERARRQPATSYLPEASKLTKSTKLFVIMRNISHGGNGVIDLERNPSVFLIRARVRKASWGEVTEELL